MLHALHHFEECSTLYLKNKDTHLFSLVQYALYYSTRDILKTICVIFEKGTNVNNSLAKQLTAPILKLMCYNYCVTLEEVGINMHKTDICPCHLF